MEHGNEDIPECPPMLIHQAEALNAREGHLTDCEKCKGKGYIYQAEYYDRQGYWSLVQKKCTCYQTYKNKQLIRESGLEQEIETASFDNYKISKEWQAEALTKAKGYNSGWFYIGGQVGSGKTMLCTCIVKKFLEAGISTIYMPWVSDSRRLKSVINDYEYDDRMARYQDCEVLYIDDLFKNRNAGNVADTYSVTESDVRIAFDILDGRYKSKKKTIISSEFSLRELDAIDSGLSSRIYEMTKKAGNYITIDRRNQNNYRLRKE